jgi:hypothetical protein
VKIPNRAYSQWIGREELFERERGRDPDLRYWDSRVMAMRGYGASVVVISHRTVKTGDGAVASDR